MKENKEEYKICSRCVMDTTDQDIQFDSNGFCNHCRGYYKNSKKIFALKKDNSGLKRIIEEIKECGKNKEYDCVIGVSGGVDSTFVAYQIKKFGLRPLAVHFDNGWDSELAVSNIEKTLKKMEIDLYTYVVNWEEFKDLQLSFLKSSIINAEIPTDHAIMAVLYKVAAEKNINYIIGGSNFVTEGIMPFSWSYNYKDLRLIKDIQKRFGKMSLKSFPVLGLWQYLFYSVVRKIKYIHILNYIAYNKKEAVEIIENELGWKNYQGKHYESIYTRFFQAYILPKKFHIDKRKAHLSTLICSSQMTREEALDYLSQEVYSRDGLREDKDYVIKKLGITEKEFEEIISLPQKTFKDYKSNYWIFKMKEKLMRMLRNSD